MHIINNINLCPECKQLPDIRVTGVAENGPKAIIACCGFKVEIQAKTKEEALKVAVDAWNLKTDLST